VRSALFGWAHVFWVPVLAVSRAPKHSSESLTWRHLMTGGCKALQALLLCCEDGFGAVAALSGSLLG